MSFRIVRSVLVAITLVVAGCASEPSQTQTLSEIAVYDFDGQPDLIVSEGRPLVINFFAETCVACVTEMPAFELVHLEVADRVDFIGVSEDATAVAGRRIAEETGITYRAVWDADGTAATQLRAGLLPTTVFVHADGTVARVHLGALSADDLRAEISDLRTEV